MLTMFVQSFIQIRMPVKEEKGYIYADICCNYIKIIISSSGSSSIFLISASF